MNADEMLKKLNEACWEGLRAGLEGKPLIFKLFREALRELKESLVAAVQAVWKGEK